MKREYKPRTAICKLGIHDNPVEPNQAVKVQEMLYMYTRGMELPERIGSYDEDVNIDEIGYLCTDRLEAVDYLNSVNQRIALQKMKSQQEEVPTVVETPIVE